MHPCDLVLTWRGGVVENSHTVHAAVVDSSGQLLYTVGNASRLTLTRSAAKPFQALAILETGVAEKFDFDAADVALVCSSHNAEERHISRATAMLHRVGVTEQDLRCGGHAALSKVVNNGWIEAGLVPTAICNNCCAKHVGMLAAAKALGVETQDYHEASHPVQERIKRVVEDLSGLKPNEVHWGIDGCNAPAPALPLYSLARMYATLAGAVDQTDVHGAASSPRTKSLSRIFESMSANPEMIAGDSRFCTNLIRTFSGALVGKIGADGCYGIAVRESEATRRLGSKGAIGIAVKIEDGNIDILYAAVMEILEQLNIGTRELRNGLSNYHYLEPKNTMGVVTGRTSFALKVKRV